jgi:hypothetical protein
VIYGANRTRAQWILMLKVPNTHDRRLSNVISFCRQPGFFSGFPFLAPLSLPCVPNGLEGNSELPRFGSHVILRSFESHRGTSGRGPLFSESAQQLYFVVGPNHCPWLLA